jgi:hypothetical protein
MVKLLSGTLAVAMVCGGAAALAMDDGGDSSRMVEPARSKSIPIERLLADRASVDQAAGARIGIDYACSVVSHPTKSSAARLLIYVTSREAARRAEQMRRELKEADHAEVKLTSRRFRQRTMRSIRRAVEASLPEHPTSSAIGFQSPIGRSSCPRLELSLLPPGEAGEAMEDWAAAAVNRYGRDRVSVVRWPGATQRT